MSDKCYIIHHNNKLFTIPTLKENLVISSENPKILNKFTCVLKNHKLLHDKWLNKCRLRTRHSVYLSETSKENYDLDILSITDIDIKQLYQLDHEQLNRMYGIHNMKLFIMEDFQYDNLEQPLLSIQGFTLEISHINYNYNFMQGYLNFILEEY